MTSVPHDPRSSCGPDPNQDHRQRCVSRPVSKCSGERDLPLTLSLGCSAGTREWKGIRVAIDREKGVRRASVGQLLDEELSIPPYQRPYSWESATALQLLDDIRGAFRDQGDRGAKSENTETSYVLGAIILHRDDEEQSLNVVDGQQRLLTLIMLLDILDAASEGADLGGAIVAGEDSQAPVVVARQRLANRVRLMEDDPHQLASFVRSRCELIRVETDDADEAFRVFDSQNYRGKALLPHDLLKAYHLREMQGETDSMKAGDCCTNG